MNDTKTISIFIVDDDVSLHDLYKEVFKNEGYRTVAEAYDGKEAIEIYAKLKEIIDIVLMDYRMPVINGLEILRQFLKLKPDANVILSSGDESVREKALESGACDFMAKPFRIDSMVKTIKYRVFPA